MCQAKPMPRCSSHAPGLVQASAYKYQIAKAATDKQKDKVESLILTARSKGFSEDEIEAATNPALTRLSQARTKLRQCIDESNERLRDIWEAELHYDATKVGFKELTSNASLQNRDQRSENAMALREWHKNLRSIKGNDGQSIFSKDGDEWMKNAILEEEYAISSRKYKEQAFQYAAVTGELKKMKATFDLLALKTAKTPDDVKEMERLKRHGVAVREQQSKIHYAMILERTKKNLIDTSVSESFKETLEKASK
jgi:hypothetical protein